MFLAFLFLFVFPNNQVVHTQAGVFKLELCKSHCIAPVRNTAAIRVTAVDSYTDCKNKIVYVSSDIPQKIQARALIHEFVHVGMHCDVRLGDREEYAAEAVSALFDNAAVSIFIQGAK